MYKLSFGQACTFPPTKCLFYNLTGKGLGPLPFDIKIYINDKYVSIYMILIAFIYVYSIYEIYVIPRFNYSDRCLSFFSLLLSFLLHEQTHVAYTDSSMFPVIESEFLGPFALLRRKIHWGPPVQVQQASAVSL